MLTFDPEKWGDTELERWNGVVTAMRVKMHQYIHLRLHYGLKNGMTAHTIIFHSEQQGDPAIIRMRGMWIRKIKSD